MKRSTEMAMLYWWDHGVYGANTFRRTSRVNVDAWTNPDRSSRWIPQARGGRVGRRSMAVLACLYAYGVPMLDFGDPILRAYEKEGTRTWRCA